MKCIVNLFFVNVFVVTACQINIELVLMERSPFLRCNSPREIGIRICDVVSCDEAIECSRHFVIISVLMFPCGKNGGWSA